MSASSDSLQFEVGFANLDSMLHPSDAKDVAKMKNLFLDRDQIYEIVRHCPRGIFKHFSLASHPMDKHSAKQSWGHFET